MTLKEFSEKYDGFATAQLKKDFLNDNLKINNYINFVDKKTSAKKVVEVTSYKIDKDGNKTGVNVDSVSRYMFTQLELIDLYTNIDVNFLNALDEYDVALKTGCLVEIIEKIPEDKIKEFTLFVQMLFDDLIQNEFSTYALVNNQVNRIVNILNTTLPPVVDIIKNKIDELGLTDEQINSIRELAKHNQLVKL